jgi:hypothetical protein
MKELLISGNDVEDEKMLLFIYRFPINPVFTQSAQKSELNIPLLGCVIQEF